MDEKELLSYIENEKDENKLKEFLISSHPYDIAKVFEKLDEENRKKIYKILNSEEVADIFAYLDEEDAADYLEEMDHVQSSSILNEMDIDDAVDIINELDNPEEIIDLLEKDTKEDVDDLTVHKEGTAGSIMTTNFIKISSEMDVKEAMKVVVTEASDSEVIDPLFVCKGDTLVGILSLKNLIMARTPKTIEEIMETNYISADVDDDIEEVNKMINNYDVYALPILDGSDIVGIITIDDAFDTIEESINQDYKQMAAINSVTKDDSFLGRLLKRLPWLIVLLLLSFFVSNVLGLFEEVIKQVTILSFFQTMLLDMAGNIGTQSLAVTIQKMTNDELEKKDKVRKHIWREVKISLINSLILSIITYATSLFYLAIRYNGSENIFVMALVIAISLFITLLFSGFISCSLPLILRKMKIDPAVASGPFITTINDIVSILIYFSFAILLLGLVL